MLFSVKLPCKQELMERKRKEGERIPTKNKNTVMEPSVYITSFVSFVVCISSRLNVVNKSGSVKQRSLADP